MYGSHVAVLQEIQVSQGTLKLTQSVQHSHGFLKSGRGTIKTRITYSVYVMPSDASLDCIDLHYTTRKSDATKIYKLVLKLGLETYLKVVNDAAELVEEFKRA